MLAKKSLTSALASVIAYRAWSPVQHCVIASILLASIVLLASSMVSAQRTQLLNQQEKLTQMEQSLKIASAHAEPLIAREPDFTQRWPQRDEINGVVRFLGALAQQHQANLGQMTISHTASSSQAAGRVDILVSINSTYSSGKQILSELLGRYSSLALQTLTTAPRSGDAARIEWTLALTMYVKD